MLNEQTPRSISATWPFSEPAGSVRPPVTYPSGSLPQPPACVQYCLNTALLPAPLSPATGTFQPDPEPVVSSTAKSLICAVVVCA